MPAARFDGGLWAHLLRAVRAWAWRAFGSPRAAHPAWPPPGGTPALPPEAGEARGGDVVGELPEPAPEPPSVPGAPAPLLRGPPLPDRLALLAPVPATVPPPRLPPPPPAAQAPHTRMTWAVRWRRPLIHAACPRCGAALDLPLWSVLYGEEIICQSCTLRLGRGAAPPASRA
jgi:hypothetical protein